MVYGNNNWATQIQGTTPDYLTHPRSADRRTARPSPPGRGAAAKVALLGKTVVDNLFGGEDPVGKMIRIKNVPFTVAGRWCRRANRPPARTRTTSILLPITTAKKKVIGANQANAAAVGHDHGAGARGHDQPTRRTR